VSASYTHLCCGGGGWGLWGRGEEVSARLIPPILPFPHYPVGALPFGCNAPRPCGFSKGVRPPREHPGRFYFVEVLPPWPRRAGGARRSAHYIDLISPSAPNSEITGEPLRYPSRYPCGEEGA
jgi:hypothetical protein